MNALQVMDIYLKEVTVIQVSTRKNDIKVQYLYDSITLVHGKLTGGGQGVGVEYLFCHMNVSREQGKMFNGITHTIS